MQQTTSTVVADQMRVIEPFYYLDNLDNLDNFRLTLETLCLGLPEINVN
jgi:hypothetical protein